MRRDSLISVASSARSVGGLRSGEPRGQPADAFRFQGYRHETIIHSGVGRVNCWGSAPPPRRRLRGARLRVVPPSARFARLPIG
jgi:hypothetical protein